LTHFIHPTHQLVKTQSSSERFTCDLCRNRGTGLHYQCRACRFDLHEKCAELPEKMSFFAHPWHDLHLQPAGSMSRICDLCMEPVQGFCYRCIPCNFDVHPECSKMQQTVYTNFHPQHTLCLVPTSNCKCNACNLINRHIWLYRCLNGPSSLFGWISRLFA
ncbi:Cysteine/Histidine-rich C1 domain family protein, partial [Rhynchospora pubera]